MGKLRSNRGCLTCRRRHIKCDESRPARGVCLRRSQHCQYDDSIKIIHQRPSRPKQRLDQSAREGPSDEWSQPSRRLSELSGGDAARSFGLSNEISPLSRRDKVLPDDGASPPTYDGSIGYDGSDLTSPTLPSAGHAPDSRGPALRLGEQAQRTALSPGSRLEMQFADAVYLQHFSSELGRWLDCTDAARQFTMKIPQLARSDEILLRAVACFAARHMNQPHAATQAHEQCVRLLIPRLTAADVASDDAVLCAIVILRVFEQLDVAESGTDQENHLAGCSALLQSSQGLLIDFDAPQLQHAAFWVYVRQAMYNACIYQHPPDLNLNVKMAPMPPSPVQASCDEHKLETSWSNAIVWLTAKAMRVCFQNSVQSPDQRKRQWHEMTSALDDWDRQKPPTFKPLWQEHAPDTEQSFRFPVILFPRDWHVMSFGFYHLARLLLVVYQPVVRFATRRPVGVKDTNAEQTLHHARLICGVCQSNPDVVPSLITLCHTCFIWGPLLTRSDEREQLIKLLQQVETNHAWPTEWITAALREEWALQV